MTRGTPLWLATMCFLLAGQAQAGRVLLVDASEHTGDATPILEDVVEELALQHRITALGPSLTDPYVPVPVPSTSATPVLWLVDRAQREFEDFQLETASETLDEAGRKLQDLPAGEGGELLLRMHWLYVQLALVRGEDNSAASHLTCIAELAPWWEPPVGYLTPELADQWRVDMERIVTAGVRVQVHDLPPGTRAWIDGFEIPAGEDRALAEGRHLYRVERPGFTPSRRWIQLSPGQRWKASLPSQPSWDDDTRGLLRAALAGDLQDGPADLVDSLADMAGVDLVVVAYRASDDAPGTVRAGAIVPGERSWTIPLRTCSGHELVSGVATAASDPDAASSGPVSPLLTIELGGGLRLGGPQEMGVAGGGGPAFEIGGGIDLGGHLELRGVVGLAFAGPVLLEDSEVTQRAHLIRAGGVVAPHIPLGRGTSLWLGGGGGFLLSAIVLTPEGGDPHPAEERGGFVLGALGLDFPVRQGLTVGPSISYTHGFSPIEHSVTVGKASHDVWATATRSLQLHVRFTMGAML